MSTPPVPTYSPAEWIYARKKEENLIYSKDSIEVILLVTLMFLKNDILKLQDGRSIIKHLRYWLNSRREFELEMIWNLQNIYQQLKMLPFPKYFIIHDLLAKANRIMPTIIVRDWKIESNKFLFKKINDYFNRKTSLINSFLMWWNLFKWYEKKIKETRCCNIKAFSFQNSYC